VTPRSGGGRPCKKFAPRGGPATGPICPQNQRTQTYSLPPARAGTGGTLTRRGRGPLKTRGGRSLHESKVAVQLWKPNVGTGKAKRVRGDKGGFNDGWHDFRTTDRRVSLGKERRREKKTENDFPRPLGAKRAKKPEGGNGQSRRWE